MRERIQDRIAGGKQSLQQILTFDKQCNPVGWMS
jgi:hypothetical protein